MRFTWADSLSSFLRANGQAAAQQHAKAQFALYIGALRPVLRRCCNKPVKSGIRVPAVHASFTRCGIHGEARSPPHALDRLNRGLFAAERDPLILAPWMTRRARP